MTTAGAREAMDESPERRRTWHYKQLKWSVQALKLRVPEQLVLFPDIVSSAHELALEFDHWADVIWENYGEDLTAPQMAALRALEGKLRTMSHDGANFDADLWTDAGLRSNVHWDEVRTLAAGVLDAFEWSADSAPPADLAAADSTE
jgi:hypothetical protein